MKTNIGLMAFIGVLCFWAIWMLYQIGWNYGHAAAMRDWTCKPYSVESYYNLDDKVFVVCSTTKQVKEVVKK